MGRCGGAAVVAALRAAVVLTVQEPPARAARAGSLARLPPASSTRRAARPRRTLPGQTGPVTDPLVTPDGRYLVVRGRLWRRTDPALPEERRSELVHELMDARRAKKTALAADDHAGVEAAKARVDAAKTGLGERGPVWWSDDAPDETRRMAENTRYAEWFAAL